MFICGMWEENVSDINPVTKLITLHIVMKHFSLCLVKYSEYKKCFKQEL
jgi:hypothetical protein